MPDLVTDDARQRAAILAEALGETVAELRLIEPANIVADIRSRRWANLADLVRSSAELYLHEGALIFACAADYALDRSGDPSIALEMEFQVPAVSAFFTLFLDRHEGVVALRHVWFAIEPENLAEGTRALARAVNDARTRHRSIAPLATRRL